MKKKYEIVTALDLRVDFIVDCLITDTALSSKYLNKLNGINEKEIG